MCQSVGQELGRSGGGIGGFLDELPETVRVDKLLRWGVDELPVTVGVDELVGDGGSGRAFGDFGSGRACRGGGS